MRTYEDTFSGVKIYPGKVCFTPSNTAQRMLETLQPRPSQEMVLHTNASVHEEGSIDGGEIHMRGEAWSWRRKQ